MPELHNNDALWAYLMWASKELRMMNHSRLNDETLWRLLDMGIFDWEGTDKLMNQLNRPLSWGQLYPPGKCVEGND